MAWSLEEALSYYKKQGAPEDQNALIGLLKEIQREHGGVPGDMITSAAEFYGIRESLLAALIRRIPGLRLKSTHTLELCGGPNCGKHRNLWTLAEELSKNRPDVTLKQSPCMRMCGKGPNLKWDGQIHHRADESLLRELFTLR